LHNVVLPLRRTPESHIKDLFSQPSSSLANQNGLFIIKSYFTYLWSKCKIYFTLKQISMKISSRNSRKG
jgi:hypothetical protein